MGNESKELDFKSLVDPSLWKDYETFIQGADARLEDDIRKSLDMRKQLREKLLSDPQLRERIRPREEELDKWRGLLKWAEDELFHGKVAAVDGTISNFSMVSGTRCRIGVVSTSYKNNRIEKVLYVIEALKLVDPTYISPLDYKQCQDDREMLKIQRRNQQNRLDEFEDEFRKEQQLISEWRAKTQEKEMTEILDKAMEVTLKALSKIQDTRMNLQT